MPTRPLLAALVLAVSACQSGPQPYARGLSTASTIPPSSLLRLSAAGGPAALYHLPELEPWDWQSSTPLPPLRRVIGAALDQELVYAQSARDEIIALDLQTARPRPPLVQSVRDVAIGPDGTVYTVDDSLRLVQFVRRNPVRLQHRLTARPRDLFGMRDESMMAIAAGQQNLLTVVHPGEQPARTELPSGDAAATFWGDLLAIAADSAVILTDPDAPDQLTVIPVSGHARAVLFSPSGHRFYVARREGGILVFNRFTRQRVAEIDLPGPAGALRADPYGRWLMVHPTGADSLWLVDLARDRYVGGFAADWAADLPIITNQQALLLKSGGDVIAYDLTTGDLPEAGRIRDGAADFWLPLAWTPETGTASALPDVAADTTADAGDAAEAGARVYLQLSSSQNRDWSGERARQLEQQGLPARVLDPGPGEEGFRVVLGPYPTREAAESTGRRLGRPFFIYQPDR